MSSPQPVREHPDPDDSSDEAGFERAQALGHIVFNAVLAAGFALLYVKAESLPASMWEPLGSGTFPKLVLGTLILFNLAIILQQARQLIGTSVLPPRSVRQWLWRHRLAFAALVLFTAYTLSLPWLGFRWSSLVFLLITQLALGARGPRALVAVALISILFSFGLAALFDHVFNIVLP